ncbi:glycoside hydrolase family 3 protein, partial [Anaerosporobacter sp.]
MCVNMNNRSKYKKKGRNKRLIQVLFMQVLILVVIAIVLIFTNKEEASSNTFSTLIEQIPSYQISSLFDKKIVSVEEEESQQVEEQAEKVDEDNQKTDQYSKQVEDVLASMTLHEKICQMIIVYPEALTGVSKVVSAGEVTKQALEEYPVGGILYSSGNLQSVEQTSTMINNIQSYSKIPLFIASDEEGGRVSRVMNTIGDEHVDAMLNYKDQGEEVAYENAAKIARMLKELGFNTDFAPVADVWSNPENTVIGDRAYSDSFEQAATLIPKAVEGFQDENVICTLKHFPGHGDTATDSHKGSSYIEKSLEDILNQEVLPFKAGIKQGADMVMVGHLIVKDIDEEPATLSYKMVTEILRQELGFQGVVITDGLNMEAMTKYYSSSYIATHAIQAGVDILLCPKDFKACVQALAESVKSGEISEERIDE